MPSPRDPVLRQLEDDRRARIVTLATLLARAALGVRAEPDLVDGLARKLVGVCLQYLPDRSDRRARDS